MVGEVINYVSQDCIICISTLLLLGEVLAAGLADGTVRILFTSDETVSTAGIVCPSGG